MSEGAVHVDVVLGVALVAAAYLAAWAVRRERPPAGVAAPFFTGLAALLVALNGPLHDLSDHYLFAAHMVQHLLLTLVVAPLLLVGVPGWMIDRGLRPLARWRPGAAAVRFATHPLGAFSLYAIGLIGWHLPLPYEAALRAHGLHVVEHLVLLATGALGWWPVLSRSAVAPPLPYAAQILYLFAFGIPMTVVAAMITAAERLLYPYYAAAPRLFDLSPLADQRLGGIIMWVPGGLIPLVAFTIVFFRWVAAEPEGSAS